MKYRLTVDVDLPEHRMYLWAVAAVADLPDDTPWTLCPPDTEEEGS